MSPRAPLVAIVGATGTGKSQLAVSLAQRLNGEIINGDALQMYEGLPITTNKLPLRDRKGIPHHLLGCIQLGEEPWTVVEFIDRASKAFEEIRSRGRLPILVGGSHYYTQSLLFKRAVVEENSESVTQRNQAQAWPILDADTSEMLEELRRVDPPMAMRWHPNDRRKIRRSLEIYLTTGMRASDVYKQQHHQREQFQILSQGPHVSDDFNRSEEGLPVSADSSLRYDTLIFWTHAPPDILTARLEERVDSMVLEGLFGEVELMHDYLRAEANQGRYVDQSRGIWVAIGFKECVPYITNENRAENVRQQAIDQTKMGTKQYAKRQVRWIRLRLRQALQASNAINSMFLLDASDLSQWSHEVDAKASAMALDFLSGRALPKPAALLGVASKELLVAEAEPNFARLCKTCDKTMMSETQWANHLQSKGHRRALRPRIDWGNLYPKKHHT